MSFVNSKKEKEKEEAIVSYVCKKISKEKRQRLIFKSQSRTIFHRDRVTIEITSLLFYANYKSRKGAIYFFKKVNYKKVTDQS